MEKVMTTTLLNKEINDLRKNLRLTYIHLSQTINYKSLLKIKIFRTRDNLKEFNITTKQIKNLEELELKTSSIRNTIKEIISDLGELETLAINSLKKNKSTPN